MTFGVVSVIVPIGIRLCRMGCADGEQLGEPTAPFFRLLANVIVPNRSACSFLAHEKKGNSMLLSILYYGGMSYLMISFFAMFVILFLNIEGGDVENQIPLWAALLWPRMFIG